MNDQARTDAELIAEISVLKQRISELEHSEARRTRVEEALRESEERYQRITEAITDYIYSVRVADGHAAETTHGPGCRAVTGYWADEFANDPYLWFRMVAEIDTPELNQELAQLRAQLAQTQAALALAETTAARWADLVKSSSVSEQEAAEKKADLELKSATVAAARANVRRLEELQSFGRVNAPFAGTITARGTDIGQLVASSSGNELFRLAQTRTLRVFVRVPQSAAQGVAPGQMTELTIPELPGRVFPAKVVRTSGAMSADSRTLLTEMEVDNSRGEILAGTYVQVRLTETKVNPTLTLPSNTLLFRSEGPQVGVVGTDGKVNLRSVTLGRDFGPSVEILGGVGPSDRVILNPADSLVGGITVRVAEAASKESAAAGMAK